MSEAVPANMAAPSPDVSASRAPDVTGIDDVNPPQHTPLPSTLGWGAGSVAVGANEHHVYIDRGRCTSAHEEQLIPVFLARPTTDMCNVATDSKLYVLWVLG